MSAQPLNTQLNAQNPWPGLSAFDEAAQDFFNGRDAESVELLRLVGQAPLTMLFGKSGLGKTSLVQAGLFPRLRQQNILPVYVRLDVRERSAPLIEQAAAALQAEIRKCGVDATAANASESLWEHLHGRAVQWWSPKNQPLTPLFVFDQFEEVFTLGAENADAIERLRLDIADLIENRIPENLTRRIEAGALIEQLDLRSQRYKVVLSFREDFLPEVEGWKGELPSLLRNRLRLLPMSADRALQVVSGETPTGRTHELVDDDTAREIVSFVAAVQTGNDQSNRSKSHRKAADLPWGKLEIEPALLSLLCEGLNEKRKALVLTTIDATLLKETGPAIIGDFYRNCVANVPEKTRRFIEDALITESGFRNSYPLEDAMDQGLLTEPLLRQLVDRRLLRIDHQLGADRVELIHDRLTEVVREHRDRERERLRIQKQRMRTVLLGCFVAVFLVLTAVFFALWKQADTEHKKATSSRLLAEGQLVRSKHASLYPLSVLLGIEAVKHDSTPHFILNQFLLDSLIMQQKPLHALQHDDKVKWAVYSPNGKQLATASADKTTRLWDAATGKELQRLSHDGNVTAVSFSPDGKQLATASADKTARLWDAATGKELQRLSHDGSVTAVSFSPDGKQLATASGDKTARLWDAATGKELQYLSHDGSVTAVSFSPDGKQLATASGDKTARLWDAATGKKLQRLSHEDVVTAVSFSTDGQWLATASGDNTARLWDAATGKELQRLSHDDVVFAVSFSPDGQQLATASADKTARLWDAATGKELQRLRHNNWVTAASFSPDGKQLATTSNNNTAQLWDAATGKELQRLSHDGYVTAVSFSPDPDGKRLATASVDKTARLWLWQPEDLANQLCGRLSYNLSWSQWREHLEGEPYCKTCPDLPINPDFRDQGRQLVNQGESDEAVRMIKELNATYPLLQLNPEQELQRWTAPIRLTEAKRLLKAYKIVEAISAFNEVEQMDATIVTTDQWNNLCWDGALANSAQQVLFACDKAVAAAKNDDLWRYRDSRGLARALIGNSQGAIEDFEFLIEKTGDEKLKNQRQAWVQALLAGQNPFTKEELESLRGQ